MNKNREENIKKILAAIDLACPERKELSFGCEVVYGSDEYEPRTVTIGNPYEIRGDKVFNPWNLDDSSYLVGVLGKPPTLAMVLAAINSIETDADEPYIALANGGTFISIEPEWKSWDFSYLKDTNIVVRWNLHHDSLYDQSDETVEYIASILSHE